jgi:hypothetical protein
VVGLCFYYSVFRERDHLWVAIAPSLERKDYFLCVNVSTKRENSDVTCELNRGEHPGLTSESSIIVYAQAREFPRAMIKRLSTEQNVAEMPPNVLLKIQKAPLTETSRLPNKFKKSIKKHLSIP